MIYKAVVKKDLEAFDGTKIRKGEVVDVTYPLFYEPKEGVVTISIGRRKINCVSIKDLKM